MEQFDQFIEYLFTIEESNTQLTADQFDKLKTIQGKVSDLVKKMQIQPQIQQQVAVTQPVQKPQLELQLAEARVQRFSDFMSSRIK